LNDSDDLKRQQPPRFQRTVTADGEVGRYLFESPLHQIIEVLQQVMCTHDAEKLAISVLEIYKGGTEP
jgi:hypothetical protein